MSYFEDLQQDWDTLGFHHRTPVQPAFPVEPIDLAVDRNTGKQRSGSYTDLHRLLLNLSRNIAASPDANGEQLVATESDLVTDLGKRMLFLCHAGHQGPKVTRTCQEAEPFFVQSLRPEVIQDKHSESPIIVVRGDQITGVIKQLGQRGHEKNYYALSDDPSTGTYAGNIYLASEPPFQAPNANHAWTVQIESARDRISDVRRLATFALPVPPRKYLYHKIDHNAALTTSHEALVELAHQAYKYSEHVDADFLYPKDKEPTS